MKKRIASLALATTLLTGSLIGVSATSASAAGVCSLPAWYTNNSDGYAYLYKDANLRKAPYGECASKGIFAKGQKFYYWCLLVNAYDNYWVYGRIAGTDTTGWMYFDNLTNHHGSLELC
ncbi:hypothetical protein [Streptomyces sp. NBC_00582]|uniref:hypothetical protein n=1 Tax=Streptomyces sp. NBC_00582 TaxID=2975783 RepID=UPI001063D41B|nr:hypothetical protein [Streptomyces sp. NBC_00582]WUB65071.1 hypothetical protein OG852_34045 [Streptomyces sp. NBC_00582]